MNRWVVSDLHGNYNIWNKMNHFIDKEDQLFCLGDNIDRKRDGIKIFREMYNRPNTVILKGNHEDMAATAIKELVAGENDYWSFLWFGNGGKTTWKSMKSMSDGMKLSIAKVFEELPITVTVGTERGKIFLNHCGFTPGIGYKELWDRNHIFHTDKIDDNIFVIHGHTPTQYVREDLKLKPTFKPEVLFYAGGHKIDIDLCTVETKCAVLFNIDTFEEIYFYDN